MTADSAHIDDRDALDPTALRRRRIRVRAWRRGMREMDLILGGFADARLDKLTEEELTQFEALLDAPDNDALAWFCAGAAPGAQDTLLFRKILAFHVEKRADAR